MDSKATLLRNLSIFFVFMLIAGCASSSVEPVQSVAPPPPPLFPPLAVMQDGDYAAFFNENSEILKSCQDPEKCVIALFNLSFLYCYSKSPYYDLGQGLKCIEDLKNAAPDSVWAAQAQVWKDLIEKNIRKKVRKRPSREEPKGKATVESSELPEESAKPSEPYRESDWELDRQRLEDEVQSKEEIIKQLRRQLERSRQIDIEMEERERGLLQH